MKCFQYFRQILVIAVIALPLTSCGQTGDLYLPQPIAAAQPDHQPNAIPTKQQEPQKQ